MGCEAGGQDQRAKGNEKRRKKIGVSRTWWPDGFHFLSAFSHMECETFPPQSVTPLSPGRGGARAGAAGVRDVCGPGHPKLGQPKGGMRFKFFLCDRPGWTMAASSASAMTDDVKTAEESCCSRWATRGTTRPRFPRR